MLPDVLLPYSEVDPKSQLFRQKWHHLRWLNTEQSLRRYTQLTLIGIPFIIILWWLIERLNLSFGYAPPELAYRLITLTLIAVLVTMALSSFYSLPRVMGHFQTQFNSAYWDALRLTPQFNSTILMAHDAVAQIRLWPFTAVEIGLRTAVVALYALNNIYEIVHSSTQTNAILWQMLLDPTFIGLSGIIFCVGIVFIVEPVIRVRLIIALHITIATRIRNVPTALLMGLAAITIIHLAQLFLIVCLYVIYQAFTHQNMGGVGLALCFVPLAGIIVVLIWAFYRWLRKAALDLAYDSAFRQD
jgi:hypothetical protein